MVWFFSYENDITITDQAQDRRGLGQNPYPNLIRYKPSGNYFGRVRVNGK